METAHAPRCAAAAPPLTRRIDLNVGCSCNMRCRFCYYLNDVTRRSRHRDLSTAQCKRLIRWYRQQGFEVLEFTGGEPTIRQDLLALVAFAKTVGFRRVSMITNGVRLAKAAYAQELVSAGVDDFLFSLHGSRAETHDYVTRLEGSYRWLLEAIQNLLSLSVKVRCNSVVTGATLGDTIARAALVKSLGVATLNFIMFNPIEQAKGTEEANFLRYDQAAPLLKKLIDEYAAAFTKLTIRYMPLCLMQGYEPFIQNVHQVHYDHDEWDYLTRAFVRESYGKWLAGLAWGLALLPGKRCWWRWGADHACHAAILEAHSWLHKHTFAECRRCSYAFICGGIWKEYARRFGAQGLQAVSGRMIIEPWHFMNAAQRAEDAA